MKPEKQTEKEKRNKVFQEIGARIAKSLFFWGMAAILASSAYTDLVGLAEYESSAEMSATEEVSVDIVEAPDSDKYIVLKDQATLDYTRIRVDGPKDVLDQIDHAAIQIDLTGKTCFFHKSLDQLEQFIILKRNRFIGLTGTHHNLLLGKDGHYLSGNHIDIHISTNLLTVQKLLDHQSLTMLK